MNERKPMYQIPALTPEMLAKLDEARANVEDATAILQAVARKRDEDAKK